MKIDINCDMGESFGAYRMGDDEKIMPFITSANVACGFHAGDPVVMAGTVRLAAAHNVAVGAHPGYADLVGFGRRNMETSPGEIKNLVLYQVGAMAAFTAASGVELQHVKLHGALYNYASADERAASEVIEAVKSFDPELWLFAPSGSMLVEMAKAKGMRVAREAFADRAYNGDGRLVSRKLQGSVIRDLRQVRERVVKLVKTGAVASIDGDDIALDADTLCIHGDTPGAWQIAKTVREALDGAGIRVVPFGRG